MSILKTLLQSPKLLLGATIASAVIGTTIYVVSTNGNENNENAEDESQQTEEQVIAENNQSETETQNAIKPPFEEMDIVYETFSVPTDKDTVITTKKGSKIHIPQSSFTFENGEEVEGPVDLKYREFHNPMELFLSGIPMTYDSAGTQYTFESAGMLDIDGEKDGKKLKIKEDSPLTIEMVSKTDDPKFNLYKIDESTGQWNHLGKDEVKDITQQNIAEKAPKQVVAKEVASDEPEFVKPEIKDEEKFAFPLDIDKAKFSELAMYNNLLFEINNNHCEFSEDLFSVVWDNVALERNKIKNNYSIVLSKKDTSVSLVAYPVVEKEHYEKALAEYNKAVALKKTKRQERVAIRQTQNNNQDLLAALTATATSSDFVANRVFNINAFGTFNMDHPLSVPQMIASSVVGTLSLTSAGYDGALKLATHKQVAVTIKDKFGKKLNYELIYYSNLDKNALFTADPNSKFAVKKNTSIVMWAITNEGNIVIVDPNMFEKEIKESKEIIFEAPVYDRISGVQVLENLINNS